MDKLDELMEAAVLGGPGDLLDVAAELVARQKKTEAALERIWPGWDTGSHAPWCKGACCDMS